MNAITFGSAEAADAWCRGAELRNRSLQVATDRMLRAAGVGPGIRVLDVGAGSGDTSLMVARLSLPGGEVVAVDISAPMLDVARQAAHQAGITNLRTMVMDVRDLDSEASKFDAAIARHALQYLGDLASGLKGIRAALRPDARVAALVWGPAAENRYMWLPVAVARRLDLMRVPDDAVMTPFRLGDIGGLVAALDGAGFSNVTVERITVERRHPSLSAAVERFRDGALFRALTAPLTDAEIELLVIELAREIEPFVVDGAVVGPGIVLLAAANSPAD